MAINLVGKRGGSRFHDGLFSFPFPARRESTSQGNKVNEPIRQALRRGRERRAETHHTHTHARVVGEGNGNNKPFLPAHDTVKSVCVCAGREIEKKESNGK